MSSKKKKKKQTGPSKQKYKNSLDMKKQCREDQSPEFAEFYEKQYFKGFWGIGREYGQ